MLANFIKKKFFALSRKEGEGESSLAIPLYLHPTPQKEAKFTEIQKVRSCCMLVPCCWNEFWEMKLRNVRCCCFSVAVVAAFLHSFVMFPSTQYWSRARKMKMKLIKSKIRMMRLVPLNVMLLIWLWWRYEYFAYCESSCRKSDADDADWPPMKERECCWIYI